MTSLTAAGVRAGSSRRSRSRHRAVLAALPDPDEQQRLAEQADQRAREALAAAAAAGAPLIDALGRPRSFITLPEYRLGVPPANKGRRYPAEVLSPSEVLAILNALPPNTSVGARNRALIVVMWRAGLRIAETLALQPKDVDLALGAITILRGKGSKRRIVAMDRMTRRYLVVWFANREKLPIPTADDVAGEPPVFCTASQGAYGGPMGDSTVREMLKLYARKAGIRKRVTPHGLRHTCAFDMSEDGVPMTHIQQQLGHEDLAMTDHYVRHLAPRHLFASIGDRDCPDDPAPTPIPITSLALSDGQPARSDQAPLPDRLDPPEPRAPQPARGAAAQSQKRGEQLRGAVLETIRANGGAATQGQLRRAIGCGSKALLSHLHALHAEGALVRAGYDRNRSIIWKIAPPKVVMRRTAQLRCAPNGEGPLRILDALDALDGRASQAELARLLALDPETIRGHCITLEASGQLERGGLDKTTSRRGSQIWMFPPPARARYQIGLVAGHTMRFACP